MLARLLVFVWVALLLSPAVAAEARQRIQSLQVTESATLPLVQPDWPVPSEPNQIFYVQRSINSNTVVYTVRFNRDGSIDQKNPVHVYWRRYDTNGARKALKFVEQKFVYGVNVRRGSDPGQYFASVKPLRRIEIEAMHTGPGQAEIRAELGGRTVRPIYAYVDIDESGVLQRVTSITIFGQDIETGRYIGETFGVTGGQIPQ